MGILNKDINGKGIWNIAKKFLMGVIFTFICVIITGDSQLSLALGLIVIYLEFKFIKN